MTGEAWAQTIKKELKEALGKGFYIGPDKSGSTRLQQRIKLEDGSTKTTSEKLPYPWAEASVVDICGRLRAIGASIEEGKDLKRSVKRASGASNNAQIDWPAAVKTFEEKKRTTGAGVGDRTWNTAYLPVLRKAARAEKAKKGATADDVLRAVAKDYELGSRSRTQALRICCRFFEHAIRQHDLPVGRWTPTLDMEELRGKRKEKREQYALTDEQVLRVINSLISHGTQPATRWAWAIQLMATFGLRPIEIHFIQLRADGSLWCTYRKKSGGGTTKPRKLRPIPVMDNGKPVQWRVMTRLKLGEELPRVNDKTKTGVRLGEALDDLTSGVWQQIREEALADDLVAVPYGFRHRYSRAGHAAGIPDKHLADSMGHTLAVHQNTYARFNSGKDADAAFEAAFACAQL